MCWITEQPSSLPYITHSYLPHLSPVSTVYSFFFSLIFFFTKNHSDHQIHGDHILTFCFSCINISMKKSGFFAASMAAASATTAISGSSFKNQTSHEVSKSKIRHIMESISRFCYLTRLYFDLQSGWLIEVSVFDSCSGSSRIEQTQWRFFWENGLLRGEIRTEVWWIEVYRNSGNCSSIINVWDLPFFFMFLRDLNAVKLIAMRPKAILVLLLLLYY